ncbi:MAG: aminotransferase class V-fold PLP-dependent enzyme [Acidobacteria bacterium]|nr:aminotransferase class V-fold PLP-dependent enzyme [Acidobacteriota bacterium]
MPVKMTRRSVLQGGASAAVLGAAACGSGSEPDAPAAPEEVYRRLGIEPVINAVGTVTVLGGSLMPPEVTDAMVAASRNFVPLPELQERAGDHIARLIGVPAAMISAGAASAMTCGTAAAIGGDDDEKLRMLPDTTGMRNEVIQQRAHLTGYQAQMELVGAKIVWVDTREELEAAINERTAMMFFLNFADPRGQIGRAEWVEVAQAHGVPTMNDAAADIPPPERLHAYVEEGFDMVAFSGGKGLMGPQATGLLLGRPELIQAARRAISPFGGIGRGMKVGKEEIIGLVAAVERYVSLDHDAERRELDARAERISGVLGSVSGLSLETHVPEIANHVPHVVVNWHEGDLGLTSEDAVARLLEGDPPIAVSRSGEGQLRISTWMLRPGQDAVVAERVRALFA